MSLPVHDVRHISVNLETTAPGSVLHTQVKKVADASSVRGDSTTQNGSPNVPGYSQGLEDIGWNTDKDRVPRFSPDGVDNEDIWLLIRRFNKRIYHLRAVDDHPEDLDFNIAPEEEFSPNKLRAQLARLYMDVILGILIAKQHIARLRSWREPRRTAAFCLIYFASWYADYLLATILIVSLGLLLSPRIRRLLFPPAPPALVDYQSGGLAQPPAGILGSVNSVTGAPENVKGEALENEASNFVTAIAAISITALTDSDPQHDRSEGKPDKVDILPEPNMLAIKVATAKDKASGVDNPSHDKSKQSIEVAMWSSMRQLMHAVSIISDSWERCANLLSPHPSFSSRTGRCRVTAVILILLLVSTFITAYMVYKFSTFAIGVGLFAKSLDHYLAVKTRYILNNLIFKDVPTDAQVAIGLLRHAEDVGTPLIPPPFVEGSPSHQPHALGQDVLDAAAGDDPLGATKEEIVEAAVRDTETLKEAGGGDHESTASGSRGGKKGKMLTVVKSAAKVLVKGIIGVDKLRAKTGSESAKNRLGAASTIYKPAIAGPVEFRCRYLGDDGYIYVTTDSVSPCICFSVKPSQAGLNNEVGHQLRPMWTLAIEEIVELNKYSGFGSKAKLMAGWALDEEILDGIEIKARDERSIVITAMEQRDELFNRLCAIGKQRWKVL